MKFIFLIIIVLSSTLGIFNCQTTETIQPVITDEPRTTEVIEEKPDVVILELPQVSQWSAALYSKYNSSKFRSFPPANERIDFSKIDYPLLNAAVFYDTNRRRKEMELPTLEYSPALEKAAIEHSKDMVELEFYSHTSPVSGRENPKKRLENYEISNAFTAENINIGFGIAYEGGRPVYTPVQNKGQYFSYDLDGVPLPPQTYNSLARSVVDSWMNSVGHRKNILNTNLKYLGIGSAHYKDKKFYDMDKFKFTQKFSSIPGRIK